MIGCIIQARTGSKRLPGKVMMSIDQNDAVLSFGIKQIKSCKKIDDLVIATTDLPEDDIIVDYMNKLNIKTGLWFLYYFVRTFFPQNHADLLGDFG